MAPQLDARISVFNQVIQFQDEPVTSLINMIHLLKSIFCFYEAYDNNKNMVYYTDKVVVNTTKTLEARNFLKIMLNQISQHHVAVVTRDEDPMKIKVTYCTNEMDHNEAMEAATLFAHTVNYMRGLTPTLVFVPDGAKDRLERILYRTGLNFTFYDAADLEEFEYVLAPRVVFKRDDIRIPLKNYLQEQGEFLPLPSNTEDFENGSDTSSIDIYQ